MQKALRTGTSISEGTADTTSTGSTIHRLHREDYRFKMLCSRCVLPFLAFYVLLEEMSAFVLPNRLRKKRDVSWLDQEFIPRLPDRSEQGDLSLGDAGEMSRVVDGRHSQSGTFLIPLEHLPVYRHNHHQHKNNEKRRKVAPLDTIGSSLMSSHRNRKDEPDVDWEDYSE